MAKPILELLVCCALCFFMCACTEAPATAGSASTFQPIPETMSSSGVPPACSPAQIYFPTGDIAQQEDQVAQALRIIQALLPEYSAAMSVYSSAALLATEKPDIQLNGSLYAPAAGNAFTCLADIDALLGEAFTPEFTAAYTQAYNPDNDLFIEQDGQLYQKLLGFTGLAGIPLTTQNLVLDEYTDEALRVTALAEVNDVKNPQQKDYTFATVQFVRQQNRWLVQGARLFQYDAGRLPVTLQSINMP